MRFTRLRAFADQSRFRANFLKVAGANLIALVLPIAATPILTRMFAPGDYGALAVFTSTLAILASVSTWRFDWALPNTKSVAMAASVFMAGGIALATTCALVAVGVIFVGSTALADTPVGRLGHLLFLLPIALAGFGLRQMFSGWFVRQGDLTAVSRATIAQSAVNVMAGLLAGVARLGAFGLIASSVVAAWAGIGALVRQAGPSTRLALRKVTPRSLSAAVQTHGRNASWSTLVSLVNALSISAPLLLLAYFYLPREVGWYALVNRLIAAPVGVLTSALGQSFWSQAAEYARAKKYVDLSRLYRRTTYRLGLASLPVAIICLMGPLFVGPILGHKDWDGAGYVLMAMTPLFLGYMLFSPTNHLVVLDMQRTQLVVDLVRLLLVVVSIISANLLELGFAVAVLLTASSSFVGHALLFLIHIRVHKRHE